jgi:hypothetical protein
MSDVEQPLRIIQWCTGRIGQISIRHLAENPRYELVGVYVTSAAKDGTDAGELAEIDPIGIAATTKKEALLALGADCVHYSPRSVDLADMEAILRSGTNIVTASGFAAALGDAGVERLEAACSAGNATVLGTGIHPGFAGDLLTLIASRVSSRLDQIVVTEVVDFSRHPSTEMVFDYVGFGRDPEDATADPSPGLRGPKAAFHHSMAVLANGLGVQVDRFENSFELSVTDIDLELTSGIVRAGTVAGFRYRWEAIIDDRPVIVFESHQKATDRLVPALVEGTNRYVVELRGEPATKLTLESLEPSVTGDPGYPGRVWTAMTAINIIPQVVAAPPGVVTHLDLPVPQPRGLIRPGTTWRPTR